tara:strand:- start:184 stop:699 length:516 start_codon:yes stop_codon:yes gene_type:complete
MKKITLISMMLFFSMNCTNINQFIDVDDMLTVKAGASKQQLLSSIGKPSMVRAGLVLNNKDLHEVWVYKVKENLTRQVLDYNRLLPAFVVPGMKPKKDFNGNGWSGSVMYGFMFKNDKLYKWGFLGDDWPDFQKSDGEYINPQSKNSGSKGSSTASSGGFLSKIPIIGSLF